MQGNEPEPSAAGVRHRQKQEKNGVSPSASNASMVKSRASRSKSVPSRCLTVVFLISVGIFVFTVAMGRFPWASRSHAITSLDQLALSVGLQTRLYAIMFDAGSTGSRILVFSFQRVNADGSLKLDNEYFEEIKPGLSYYASNPLQAAESLRPLLEKAKTLVPQEHWNETCLVLKATAGLRLLPGDKSESILLEVDKLFQSYPFRTNKLSVSIMEGSDEGLFSWFTVNFLLDYLDDSLHDTVASLDLGGGSTQITFLAEEDSLSSVPEGHVHAAMLFNRSVKLYIHSYLGLGLMAARLDILKQGNASSVPGSLEFYSPCVHDIVTKTWEYARKSYTVRGVVLPDIKPPSGSVGSKKNPVLRFEECFKIVSQVVNHKVYTPNELQHQEVYAMSYYYDRATESGLIDPFKGGIITVGDYFKAAKSACGYANVDQPFMCLDLTFISALLNQGFGLKTDKQITLRKKLDGHEISWALGAAFHVLANEDTKVT